MLCLSVRNKEMLCARKQSNQLRQLFASMQIKVCLAKVSSSFPRVRAAVQCSWLHCLPTDLPQQRAHTFLNHLPWKFGILRCTKGLTFPIATCRTLISRLVSAIFSSAPLSDLFASNLIGGETHEMIWSVCFLFAVQEAKNRIDVLFVSSQSIIVCLYCYHYWGVALIRKICCQCLMLPHRLISCDFLFLPFLFSFSHRHRLNDGGRQTAGRR